MMLHLLENVNYTTQCVYILSLCVCVCVCVCARARTHVLIREGLEFNICIVKHSYQSKSVWYQPDRYKKQVAINSLADRIKYMIGVRYVIDDI